MKLAFFELEEWQRKIVEGKFSDHEVKVFDSQLSESNIGQVTDSEVVSTFIFSNLDSETLDKFPNLKLVTTMSTGFDHIDIEKCKSREIPVCNVPSYGENTVAEHTFALIHALSKKLYQSIRRTKGHQKFETDVTLRGFDLKNRTLGLIGCGNIGKNVARIAKGYQMNVLVFDLNKDENLAKEIGFAYTDMDNLLSTADIISLNVPYNKHTHHLINEETINKMKDGVCIINTARGGLIDTDSLIKALQTGKVGGAGLDVLEGEGNIKDEVDVLTKDYKDQINMKEMLQGHILMKMENVVVTPHNAFNSWEALNRILNTTMDNVQAFIDGNPKNRVN